MKSEKGMDELVELATVHVSRSGTVKLTLTVALNDSRKNHYVM